MLNFREKINITGSHKYNSNEMLDALSEHFYGICYLCDIYVLVGFEPEHFEPKSKYPLKKNEPENLFYSCSRCNKIKSDTYNSEISKEIVNSKIDDVENLFILKVDNENADLANKIDISINLEKCSPSLKLKCKNTKELLNKIYNGENTSSVFKAGKLRKEINDEIVIFEDLLNEYDKTKLKRGYSSKIKKHISKRQKHKKYSNFVSFKRQIIKSNSAYIEFQTYFD